MINLSIIRKRQSFRSYVKKQMEASLITGVPEIASSKSNSRRKVKSFMFLFCTVGFLYQTYTFLETFLKYETLQDFRIEHPLKFMAPAVTFCNRNRINRQLFCPAFPEDCVWYENRKDFCKAVPKLCAYLSDRRGPLGVPRKGIQAYYNRSNEFLDAYGPQTPWDFIDVNFFLSCRLYSLGKRINCKLNDSILIQAPSGGLPYKCFTMFSLLDKPYEEPRNISINDYFTFTIKAAPEQLMYNADNVQFYIHVHDPRSLANPISEGISLNAGFLYTISFTMQQIQTLPPPYNTYCFDYVKKWKENGGRGPITKKDCIEICKIEKMMEHYSCVGQSITYPHRFPICSEIITISDKVVEECSSGCREACDVTLYTIASKHVEDEMETRCHPFNMKPNCKYEDIEIVLKFGQLSVRKIFTVPKFQNVEVFSFIGGFIGIWLGVSLLTFVDFLETVTDVIVFAVGKWKKMYGKKRTRRIFYY